MPPAGRRAWHPQGSSPLPSLTITVLAPNSRYLLSNSITVRLILFSYCFSYSHFLLSLHKESQVAQGIPVLSYNSWSFCLILIKGEKVLQPLPVHTYSVRMYYVLSLIFILSGNVCTWPEQATAASFFRQTRSPHLCEFVCLERAATTDLFSLLLILFTSFIFSIMYHVSRLSSSSALWIAVYQRLDTRLSTDRGFE